MRIAAIALAGAARAASGARRGSVDGAAFAFRLAGNIAADRTIELRFAQLTFSADRCCCRQPSPSTCWLARPHGQSAARARSQRGTFRGGAHESYHARRRCPSAPTPRRRRAAARGAVGGTRFVAYAELTKPRIALMVLFTVIIAAMLAGGGQVDLAAGASHGARHNAGRRRRQRPEHVPGAPQPMPGCAAPRTGRCPPAVYGRWRRCFSEQGWALSARSTWRLLLPQIVGGAGRGHHLRYLRLRLHAVEAHDDAQHVGGRGAGSAAAADRLDRGARLAGHRSGGIVSHCVLLAGAALSGHRLDSSRGLCSRRLYDAAGRRSRWRADRPQHGRRTVSPWSRRVCCRHCGGHVGMVYVVGALVLGLAFFACTLGFLRAPRSAMPGACCADRCCICRPCWRCC